MSSKIFGASESREYEDSDHWMSVSDLMSGLMIVFLFISIALMRTALIERDKIKQVAVAYQYLRSLLVALPRASSVEDYEALLPRCINERSG
jgi:hypothetical protein